jgi:predicted RNA-binding protein with PIN domain
MSLVRILVDGYSLLHNWPTLAPGRPRHSAAARSALVHVLTRYQDAVGTPITIFFDGGGAPPDVPKLSARETKEKASELSARFAAEARSQGIPLEQIIQQLSQHKSHA